MRSEIKIQILNQNIQKKCFESTAYLEVQFASDDTYFYQRRKLNP